MRVIDVNARALLVVMVMVVAAAMWFQGPDVHADDDAGAPTLIASEPKLDLGESAEFTLVYEDGSYLGYRVEVPASAKALHIVTFGCSADVDLYVEFNASLENEETWEPADHEAVTGRVDERLVIDRDTRPRLRAGTYYVYVVSYMEDDAVTGKLVATVDDPPTVPAIAMPPYRSMSGLTPLERAFDATVRIDAELGGGSGSVLTPNGYILTNHHVLYDDETGDLQTEDIFVSFSDSHRHPPQQTHTAEVVDADQDLDLALLRITHTIEGDRVPTSMKLTWMPLGDPGELDFEDTLRVIGFPGVGGEMDRSSLTLTRGIVSGFAYDDDDMVWIKTDTQINSGNSGGAAVNADAELVGVPTMTIEDENDILGYVRPVTAMPEKWQKTIKDNLRR